MPSPKTVLPEFTDYDHIWYLSAPNLNLATSPILPYLVPEVEGVEFTGSPDELAELLENTSGNHAVLIAPQSLRRAEFITRLLPITEQQTYLYPETEFILLLVLQ